MTGAGTDHLKQDIAYFASQRPNAGLACSGRLSIVSYCSFVRFAAETHRESAGLADWSIRPAAGGSLTEVLVSLSSPAVRF